MASFIYTDPNEMQPEADPHSAVVVHHALSSDRGKPSKILLLDG